MLDNKPIDRIFTGRGLLCAHKRIEICKYLAVDGPFSSLSGACKWSPSLGRREYLPESLGDLRAGLGQQVTGKMNESTETRFDALRCGYYYYGCRGIYGCLVSERLHEKFVKPLAKLLCGRDLELRAAQIAAHVTGLSTMQHTLKSLALTTAAQNKVVVTVDVAIQALVK